MRILYLSSPCITAYSTTLAAISFQSLESNCLIDFPEIHCSDYGENNFVFKIKRNRNEGEKSIGYLFSVIEENSEQFNIEQYFLQLTSLEQIFNKFAKETERSDIKQIMPL